MIKGNIIQIWEISPIRRGWVWYIYLGMQKKAGLNESGRMKIVFLEMGSNKFIKETHTKTQRSQREEKREWPSDQLLP